MNRLLDPPRFTPDDLLTMPDGDRFELLNGRLVEKESSYAAALIACEAMYLLANFLDDNPLGTVTASGATFRCFPDDPDAVRKPDVAFVRRGRLPRGQVLEGHVLIAPDLVVEVVSPNNLVEDVETKIQMFLNAGTRLVWVVHSQPRFLRIHRPDGTITQLKDGDELTGEDVLPGFRCLVRDLFRPLDTIVTADAPEAPPA
jgi:Uma2 family endonuclease